MGAVVKAREVISREKMLDLYLHFVPVCCYRHFCLNSIEGYSAKSYVRDGFDKKCLLYTAVRVGLKEFNIGKYWIAKGMKSSMCLVSPE